MIIRKPWPKSGIKFAWLPVMTSEGKVWLEHVHYEWQEHGFGGYLYHRLIPAHMRYCRMIPQDRYDAGERVKQRTTKEAYEWWCGLPNEERERIREFMTADPL